MFDHYQSAVTTEPSMFQGWLDHSLWEHHFKDGHDAKRRRDIQMGLARNEALTPEFARKIQEITPFHSVKEALTKRLSDFEEEAEYDRRLELARRTDTPKETLTSLFEEATAADDGAYDESILCYLAENTSTPVSILKALSSYPDDIGGAARRVLDYAPVCLLTNPENACEFVCGRGRYCDSDRTVLASAQ